MSHSHGESAASDGAAGLARRAALERYAILGTSPEQAFDDIALLASNICETPIALVSLVADDHQWFKARIGLSLEQTPLSQSVCVHALDRCDTLVVPDLMIDERTRDNALVTRAPFFRFYAGAPLVTRDSGAIGTLCVIDTEPRPTGLTDVQRSSLEVLARQVIAQLELRRTVTQNTEALRTRLTEEAEGRQRHAEAERMRSALLELSDHLSNLDDAAEMAFIAAKIMGRTLDASAAGYATFNADDETVVIEQNWTTAGFASLAGVHAIREYGSHIENLVRGEAVVIDDVEQDERTAARAPFLRSNSIRAFVNLPLLEHGRLVALFFLVSAVPWHWTVEMLSFVRTVAERARAAVERHHAETKLRDLAASLEQQVEQRTFERDRLWRSSQDLLLVLDATGTVMSANPAITTILGWGPEEFIGRNALDFVVPEDLRLTTGALKHASNRALPTTENRFRHKDGGFRWMSWVAAPEGDRIFATGRHITAEKEAAHALLRTAAERDRILRNARDLIVVIDMRGKFLSVNPAVTTVLGWSEAEMLQVTAQDLIDADTQPLLRQGLYIPERYSTSKIYVNRYKCKDGGHRWISWIAAAEDDRIYAYGRDVTVEKEQAEALQATEEALRQSQKMEAVGQLTGGLAHDFNNLLAGIGGSLELLQARMRQGRLEDVDRYVDAAQSAARRAAALTHRLLAFARRQTLDPKATDVNRLVAGMEDLIRRTVGPDIAVEVVAAGGLWTTLIDPSQLENALLNLCINARDAMPGGGKLAIETGNKWLDDRAARECGLPPGQYLTLCVSDNGAGMAADVIARAFEPFFTTKPIGQGTGLGLSMIYGFAQQSGGQVRIDSEVGQGTRVWLFLPRHKGPIEPVAAPNELTSAPRARHDETVLVVDDEPTVRMLVTEVLEDLGYVAIQAPDGPAGLRVLQSEARIDLLVTDVGLPGGMNGRQVADAARVVRPKLKVLFITGYAEHAVLGHADLDPGMHVLTKPFSMDLLASRVKDLIVGR